MIKEWSFQEAWEAQPPGLEYSLLINSQMTDGLLANKSKSFQSSFDRYVNITRMLSTNGLRFFLQFWFSKRPMYWIPRGWVPGYVEWVLGLPRAPMGSVSIQIWGAACGTAISIVGAAVVSVLVLARERPEQGQEKAGEPVPMGFGGKATLDKKKS